MSAEKVESNIPEVSNPENHAKAIDADHGEEYLESEGDNNNAVKSDDQNAQTAPIASEDLPEYELVENDINLNFDNLPDACDDKTPNASTPIVNNLIYKGDLVLIACDPVIGSSWFLINLASQILDKNKTNQYFYSPEDIDVLYANETLQYEQIIERIHKCTENQYWSKVKILSSKQLLDKNKLHLIDFSKDFWRTFLLNGAKKAR